ncbi:MAG: peptidase [Acidobacteriota bacterium]
MKFKGIGFFFLRFFLSILFLNLSFVENQELDKKEKKLVEVLIEWDKERINQNEKQLLNKFLNASEIIDQIFKIQIEKKFYPENMTKEEFENFVKENPELKSLFESPFTVLKRKEKELEAIPYNVEYRDYLEKASNVLKEAAQIAENLTLKKYLSQRAEDLLTDNFFQSDCDWLDLKDNQIEIVIGPYENYEDKLLGLKTSYECFIYLNDFEESKKIENFSSYLSELQKNLPVEAQYKAAKPGIFSPIRIADEIFSSGEGNWGIHAIAFALPNDEKVREEKGTRKVILRNIMRAKFENTLLPIAKEIVSEELISDVTFDGFFYNVLLHELSHPLGINFIKKSDGSISTVNKELKENYAVIEEAKADILGLFNFDYLIKKKVILEEMEKKMYATYLASIFRSIRFGAEEAHAKANLLQFNYLLNDGAITYDLVNKKYSINEERIKKSVSNLAKELLTIEGKRDYPASSLMIERYSKIPDFLKTSIEKLKDIPVDVKPVYDKEF